VLLQRNGQTLRHKAYGMADREAGRAMREDSMFRIMSMSKPVTSAAVMMLFEEGRFLLDDPVSKYLPEFDRPMQVVVPKDEGYELAPAKQAITIRHLLTHTSGIAYRFLGQQPLTDLYAAAGIGDGLSQQDQTLAEFVKRIAQMPLAHEPGTGFTYGLSVDVLGRLVEVVSGQPFDTFLSERIFQPLGMHDTYFLVPADKRERVATVYRRNEAGQLQAVPAGIITEGPVVFSTDYPFADANPYRAGGAGLVSTAADYGRFLTMLMKGGELDGARVLGRKTVELMLSDQLERLGVSFPEGEGRDFGLGLGLDGGPARTGTLGSAGAGGWSGFFSTDAFVDPVEQLVAVLMVQHYPYNMRVLSEFRVMVYQSLGW